MVSSLEHGSSELKIFALSDDVLKPDFYTTSILITENKTELPEISKNISLTEEGLDQTILVMISGIIVAAIIIIFMKKRANS